ncbi:hypothetical protein [Luteimonas cellulosilyticus]|uniref:hypothetical protein n=1 Tax=Luteimonas cellulosilyticus TaxID=2683586 RepID=UPI00135A931E|nr:hypothetical protein [Luteimonas cellulosilyticus]
MSSKPSTRNVQTCPLIVISISVGVPVPSSISARPCRDIGPVNDQAQLPSSPVMEALSIGSGVRSGRRTAVIVGSMT